MSRLNLAAESARISLFIHLFHVLETLKFKRNFFSKLFVCTSECKKKFQLPSHVHVTCTTNFVGCLMFNFSSPAICFFNCNFEFFNIKLLKFNGSTICLMKLQTLNLAVYVAPVNTNSLHWKNIEVLIRKCSSPHPAGFIPPKIQVEQEIFNLISFSVWHDDTMIYLVPEASVNNKRRAESD